MANYTATTWTSGDCYSLEAAMKCACTFIASKGDTVLTGTKIKFNGVEKNGNSFKAYLAYTNAAT